MVRRGFLTSLIGLGLTTSVGAKAQALSVLEALNASHPGQPDILNGLLAFARDAGDRPRYERYRAQLMSVMQATGMR